MLIRGWQHVFQGEAEGAGEGAAAGGSPSSDTGGYESTGDYGKTDPGYAADEIETSPVDELAALKAENEPNKETPSDEKSDDAGVAEEGASEEKSSGESADAEGFSDALLDRAAVLGYTFDDIKTFRSEKSLAKEIDRVERLQQRMSSRQVPAPAEAAPVAEEIPEPNWQQMIDEGYDPVMVQYQQHSWQRAVAAEQRAMQAEAGIQQLMQRDNQRDFDAVIQRFDATISDLEQYESLFGKGSMADVKKATPELSVNRRKVFDKYHQLKNTYQMARQPVPPEKELIEEAVHAAFWKQTTTLARKELTNDIKKAGSQALSRPRSTGAKQLSGATAAMAKEQDFWKKYT